MCAPSYLSTRTHGQPSCNPAILAAIPSTFCCLCTWWPALSRFRSASWYNFRARNRKHVRESLSTSQQWWTSLTNIIRRPKRSRGSLWLLTIFAQCHAVTSTRTINLWSVNFGITILINSSGHNRKNRDLSYWYNKMENLGISRDIQMGHVGLDSERCRSLGKRGKTCKKGHACMAIEKYTTRRVVWSVEKYYNSLVYEKYSHNDVDARNGSFATEFWRATDVFSVGWNFRRDCT